MPSSTENVKLGVCNVIFDGVDLGFTKGGVEVEVQTQTYEVKIDQFGETPISELVTGRSVSATVPMAETTLENLIKIMPGSTLVSDGVKATGTITLSTASPVDGDTVTIAGKVFTFEATPLLVTDVVIGATIAESATNLAAAINNAEIMYSATAAAGVVTLTAKEMGTHLNATVSATFATPANVAETDLTGGVDPTKSRVDVSTGVNINLLDVAKSLVLRPIGTTGEDDFRIIKAACPGALNFSYNTNQERIYTAAFKGFATSLGELFSVGDRDAV